MKIFIILPFIIDSDIESKLKILDKIFTKYKIQYSTGVKKANGNFDLIKTLKMCRTANYYIADVSHERPSCYFELGYMQALKKSGDIIAVSGTTIHQLIGIEEINFYKNLEDFEYCIDKIVSKLIG